MNWPFAQWVRTNDAAMNEADLRISLKQRGGPTYGIDKMQVRWQKLQPQLRLP